MDVRNPASPTVRTAGFGAYNGQAAQLRQSDRSAFDRLSAYASVRVERPLMRSQDAELGTVRCGGSLSLEGTGGAGATLRCVIPMS